MIDVAVIGYGLAGSVFHAPFIQAVDRLRLAAVATSRTVSLDADIRILADPMAAIDDPAIDAVVIASPNPSHFALAEAALRAGKHVVVDKPLVATVAEADALILLAERQRRVLTVFHNRRWDGDFLTVRSLVEQGALGDLLLMEAHWDRFRLELRDTWKDDPGPAAGLLFDLGPHMIDQALLLFGHPDAVSADVRARRPGSRVDDDFEIRLHYGDRRVRLCASMLIREPRPRFALHGTKASFVKFGLDPQEDALRNGGRLSDPGFGEDQPQAYGTLTDDKGQRPLPTVRGDYRHFYEAFASAVLDGAPSPVDPRDARDGLGIIHAALESARLRAEVPLTGTLSRS